MAGWAQARIPNYIGWGGYFQAIGREVAGELVGAIVYTNASPSNVMVSIVLERPFSRHFLYAGFAYPFEQLKVRRLTALVEAWNKRSRSLCAHLGFKVEGRMRQAAAAGGDVIVMGILREECRYLKRPP